jgi:hypothetical protein
LAARTLIKVTIVTIIMALERSRAYRVPFINVAQYFRDDAPISLKMLVLYRIVIVLIYDLRRLDCLMQEKNSKADDSCPYIRRS